MEKIKTIGYGASGALIGGKTLELMEFEREQPKTGEFFSTYYIVAFAILIFTK